MKKNVLKGRQSHYDWSPKCNAKNKVKLLCLWQGKYGFAGQCNLVISVYTGATKLVHCNLWSAIWICTSEPLDVSYTGLWWITNYTMVILTTILQDINSSLWFTLILLKSVKYLLFWPIKNVSLLNWFVNRNADLWYFWKTESYSVSVSSLSLMVKFSISNHDQWSYSGVLYDCINIDIQTSRWFKIYRLRWELHMSTCTCKNINNHSQKRYTSQ